jgi:hypothetical protein
MVDSPCRFIRSGQQTANCIHASILDTAKYRSNIILKTGFLAGNFQVGKVNALLRFFTTDKINSFQEIFASAENGLSR